MKSRLTWFVVAAMIAGPLFGLLLHAWLGPGAAADSAAADLSLVTTSFLHLIKMIIAPLVFSTLTVGVARMEGTASIARVGAKTLGWFIFASLISMTIGIFMVQLFKPGMGLPVPHSVAAAIPASTPPTLKDMLDHIIPSSIVQAMATNEILQIVVFSILFGLAASSLGRRVDGLIDAIEQISLVILKLTGYIMTLAPIAVFAALAATVLTQGMGVLLVYAKFIGSFYLALLVLWAFLAFAVFASLGKRSAPFGHRCSSPFQRPAPRRRIPARWSGWNSSASARASRRSFCHWAIRSIWTVRPCTARSRCCSLRRFFTSTCRCINRSRCCSS
jgi:Na+/H+-dicarboxylate symporter